MKKRTEGEDFNQYVSRIRQRFVDAVHKVDVENVSIKLKMTKESFDDLYNRRFSIRDSKSAIIPAEEATGWIEKNLDGGITKEELDQYRN